MVEGDFPSKFGTRLKKYFVISVNNARALLKAVKMVFLSNTCSAREFDLKLN